MEVSEQIMEKAVPYLQRLKVNGRKIGDKLGDKAKTAARICAENAETALQEILERASGAEEDSVFTSSGKKNYALITGASSGIGMEFAHTLRSRRGMVICLPLV